MIEYTCSRCGAKGGTTLEVVEPILCFTCRRDDEWAALGMPLCIDCGVHRVGPKHHAAGGDDCEGCWRYKRAIVRRPSRVHIDAEDHTQVFDAIVSDDDWNGWALPTFDLENALAVEAMVTRWGEGNVHFLWTTDREGRTCLILGDGYDDEIWWEPCGDEESGFPIGAYSWCWSELDEDAPHQPAALDAWLQGRRDVSHRYVEVWNTALQTARARGADSDIAITEAQLSVEARAHYIETGEDA